MTRRQTLTIGATLDASGGATREAGGPRAFQSWTLVRGTSVTSETDGSSNLRLYRDRVGPDTFLDGTGTARQDVAEYAPAPRLEAGQRLIAVWDEGTPGAEAVLTLTVDVEAV